MNKSVWSGLLDDFKSLRDLQNGDDLRSVLIEFSTPDILETGETHIPSKFYPKDYSNSRPHMEEMTISDNRPESQRIYKQLVVPYRDRQQLLKHVDIDDPLPESLRIIRNRLNESLKLAGEELLRHPGANCLPDEISGLRNGFTGAWLLFLHFAEKPDRKTWPRVNFLSHMAEMFINAMPPEERERSRQEQLETLLMEPMTINQLSKAFEISVSEMRDKLSTIEGVKQDGKQWQIPAKEYSFKTRPSNEDQDEFEFGHPNKEISVIVGSFSFEPFPENSYSEIKDISAASIKVIRRIIDGALAPIQEGPSQSEVDNAVIEIGHNTDLSNDQCIKANTHSTDFRSVYWNGDTHSFTDLQAKCIEFMWSQWVQNTPETSERTIIAEADPHSSQTRLVNVFDNGRHSAWKTMIIPGQSRGSYRLS